MVHLCLLPFNKLQIRYILIVLFMSTIIDLTNNIYMFMYMYAYVYMFTVVDFSFVLFCFVSFCIFLFLFFFLLLLNCLINLRTKKIIIFLKHFLKIFSVQSFLNNINNNNNNNNVLEALL